MLDVFKSRIIQLLKHDDYRPLKLAKLAKALEVSSEDYPLFKQAFEQLRKSGRVVIAAGNLVTLPAISNRLIGTFRANQRGFGFVTPLEPNAHGDLFIPPGETAGAMTGDIVSARLVKKGRRTREMRYSGKVTDILERAKSRFVGTLLRKPDGWFVQPDGTGFTEPITVDDVNAKAAKEKNKVVVEILSFPTERYLARGVIVEVLGKAGRYESEIASIIRQYHLPEEFDDACLNQVRKAAESFNPNDVADRQDLTDKVIITIDPPDAKDFDDAVSLEEDENRNRVLGVHIADVSHFVSVDSPLDEEAANRGNSCYLPQRTIPMLPEILSNGICSLQPGQKRFTKSVYLTYDEKGNLLSRSYANTVICSSARLTYQKVDKILKGHTKGTEPEIIQLLKKMETLSRVIENRRKASGMLNLDLPETELIFDKSGRVTDACPADDSYPHTMIEMFMVEANDAVASLLDRLNVKFMRRIHPEPDPLSLKNLARLIRSLGITLPRNPDRYALQSLLDSVENKDCSFAVNLAVLRSFEKAQYSPLNIGHFALASRHYCHFTSPIRRYADLLVHRVFDGYLQELNKDISEDLDLAEIGKHITFTEQRAEDAEQELKNVLILQMLSSRIGDELDCVVTGLAGFGVFARSKKFGIEGLIPIEDLGPDKWKFSTKTNCIVGLNTGLSLQLGLSLKARIVSINIPARQLNLTPAEPLVKPKPVSSRKNKRRRENIRKRSAGKYRKR